MELKPDGQVVVETLCTRSEAEVVWQDGSVEKGIPSKELFPIHHLDDQEFFCGDYVVRSAGDFRPHEYGVVQGGNSIAFFATKNILINGPKVIYPQAYV